jgi:hypothetical protein
MLKIQNRCFGHLNFCYSDLFRASDFEFLTLLTPVS